MAKEKEKKKAASKPRKSTDRQQDYKKRGRLSTKSKADSDEEERPPVQPISKKQKKAPASVNNKEDHAKDVPDMGQFVSMDKYMHLDSWDDLVAKVETIEKDEEGVLYLYGNL